MVLLYTPKQKQTMFKPLRLIFLDLDYQGLGVAKINGKTWFIENAPSAYEKVECRIWKINANMGMLRQKMASKKFLNVLGT